MLHVSVAAAHHQADDSLLEFNIKLEYIWE
jgi:hypothetical protein